MYVCAPTAAAVKLGLPRLRAFSRWGTTAGRAANMSSLAASEWLAMQPSTPQAGVMSPTTPLAMFFTVTCQQKHGQSTSCSPAHHRLVYCPPPPRWLCSPPSPANNKIKWSKHVMQPSTSQAGVVSPTTPLAVFFTVTCQQQDNAVTARNAAKNITDWCCVPHRPAGCTLHGHLQQQQDNLLKAYSAAQHTTGWHHVT